MFESNYFNKHIKIAVFYFVMVGFGDEFIFQFSCFYVKYIQFCYPARRRNSKGS